MTDGLAHATAFELRTRATGRAHLALDRMTRPLPSRDREIHVLGALLAELPEGALLEHATVDNLRVTHEASRLALLARLRSVDFDAVVFPVLDRSGLPTAPLIQQCAMEHSAVALFAICNSPPPRASALLAAARAGARIIVSPSPSELIVLLRDLPPGAARRVVVTPGSFGSVAPRFLRDVLAVATETVGENGRVGTFAAALNVSTRTLSRKLRQAGLPSPRTVLAAARLLCTCAEMESFPRRDAATSARLAGFASIGRLTRTARKYSVPIGGDRRHPRLPGFSDALAAVVSTLGGRLEA